MTTEGSTLTMTEVRKTLGAHLRSFRQQGTAADPVVFGHRGHAELVLLSRELWDLMCALDERATVER